MQGDPREGVASVDFGLAVVVHDAHAVRCLSCLGVNQGVLCAFRHVDIDLLAVHDVPAPFVVAFFYGQFDCHCAFPVHGGRFLAQARSMTGILRFY